jgi:hypothetical protein
MAGTGHDIDEAASIARLMCRSPASVDTYIEFAKTEARALLANRAATRARGRQRARRTPHLERHRDRPHRDQIEKPLIPRHKAHPIMRAMSEINR